MNNFINLFEIDPTIHYFNAATYGPLLKKAEQAAREAIQKRARVWSFCPDDLFDGSEKLRHLLGDIIDYDSENIAITPSASYGLSIAARNLPLEKDENIVLLAEQFPSNVYVWQKKAAQMGAQVRFASPPENDAWTEQVLATMDHKTKILALPYCHWTDGTCLDLLRLSKEIKSNGGYLVLDLSQSLGACPLDLQAIDPDFVVSVGYKWLLGSYSQAYLLVAPRWHNAEPIEYSWLNRQGARNFEKLVDYTEHLAPGARRFDVGEANNMQTIPMTTAALEQIRAWSVPFIHQSLKRITTTIRQEVTAMGLEVAVPEYSAGHMLGIKLPSEVFATKLKAAFASEQIIASVRGTRLRIAPHLHIREEDIACLLETIKNVV